LATSSVTGITINAGANDVINLQGLDIDGAGSGANGIQFNTGASLNVQNGIIRGFFKRNQRSAEWFERSVCWEHAYLQQLTGIRFQNSAISTGVLNDLQLFNNGKGIVALGASSTGPTTVTIQNSVVATNGTVGILSGSYCAIMVGKSAIGNATGWLAVNRGQVISSSNNGIGGNVTGNSAPPTANLRPLPPRRTTFLSGNPSR
jgi:hypothetical protein